MTESRIVSIQVGLPAQHGADLISDQPWESGIFKTAVTGKIRLDTLNLAGDGQHDLQNHGGKYRAVLAYSADHYPIWQQELNRDLPYGSFGENFTVSGVDEDSVCLGDIIQVGEVRLRVSQPRMPCWKLSRRVGIKKLSHYVDVKEWGGWYHEVLQTGDVQAGEAYTIIERRYPQYPIRRLYRLMVERETTVEAYRELASLFDILTPSWRMRYGGLAASYSEQAQNPTDR
ncbi:MAG: MOSC domain-containing protein [Anaerolineae bacterium]